MQCPTDRITKYPRILWDSQMVNQIANVSNTLTMHLQNILKIRKYLSATALKCIVHSFVTSRWDSNSAPLYNMPSALPSAKKLRRV